MNTRTISRTGAWLMLVDQPADTSGSLRIPGRSFSKLAAQYLNIPLERPSASFNWECDRRDRLSEIDLQHDRSKLADLIWHHTRNLLTTLFLHRDQWLREEADFQYQYNIPEGRVSEVEERLTEWANSRLHYTPYCDTRLDPILEAFRKLVQAPSITALPPAVIRSYCILRLVLENERQSRGDFSEALAADTSLRLTVATQLAPSLELVVAATQGVLREIRWCAARMGFAERGLH